MHFRWLKLRCQQGCTPSEGSRGQSVICFIHLLEATHITWLMTTSSVFKANHRVTPLTASVVTFPSLTLTGGCIFYLQEFL